MSSTKIILALCAVAFVAACAKKEEVVYTEPTYTGKYK